MKRLGSAHWVGTGAEGSGTVSVPSGALKDRPYGAAPRFASEDGTAGVNPEELVAAAHASCFSMALAFGLAANGFPPEDIRATAEIDFQAEGIHWSFRGIVLHVEARVPGIPPEKFAELAEFARGNCPISRALAAVPIRLDAKLV